MEFWYENLSTVQTPEIHSSLEKELQSSEHLT